MKNLFFRYKKENTSVICGVLCCKDVKRGFLGWERRIELRIIRYGYEEWRE